MNSTKDIVTNYINKGQAWQYEIEETFAAAEVKYLCFETGDWPVFLFDAKFQIESTPFEFALTEAGDYVTGGTQLRRVNRRRDDETDVSSVPLLDSQVLATATVGTETLVTLDVIAEGSTGNERGVAAYDNDFLWVLLPNTKYVMKITNKDGTNPGSASIQIIFGREKPFVING